MVLVPATMSLLGPWNWWLPGWLDRVLPRLQADVPAPQLDAEDPKDDDYAGSRESLPAQLPGGMTGTLKNQLAQHGMADRLDAVLAEIPQVRQELGQPIMATPFSPSSSASRRSSTS